MRNLNNSIMKKSILLMALFAILYTGLSAQNSNVQKKDPVGKWKFEAPTAPEGYASGTIIFDLVEGKYTAGTVLANFDYKFPGEKVKYANDSISFVFNLEGQQIDIRLKIEDPQKMSGKATYSEGTVPIILTKLPK